MSFDFIAPVDRPQREPKIEPLPEDREMSAFEKGCAVSAAILIVSLLGGLLWSYWLRGVL